VVVHIKSLVLLDGEEKQLKESVLSEISEQKTGDGDGNDDSPCHWVRPGLVLSSPALEDGWCVDRFGRGAAGDGA